MGNYSLTSDKRLVHWEYNWAGNKFFWEYGTSSRLYWGYDQLPFKESARLYYKSFIISGFLSYESYPERNILEVYWREDPIISIEDFWKSKGFKKFFGNKNIKEIVYHEDPNPR